MKKRNCLCLLMAGVVLAGCNNASTLDFGEFVDQYPTTTAPLPTEPVSVMPQEIETIVQESATETLYKQTVKIKLRKGKEIIDECVSGDMLAYLVEDIDGCSVYVTSLSEGGENLIYQTTDAIQEINCDDGRVIWIAYMEEINSNAISIYEDGVVHTFGEWEEVCPATSVDIDGDFIFGYWGSFHVYTYNMETEEFFVKYSQEDMNKLEEGYEEIEYVIDYFDDGHGIILHMDYDTMSSRIKCVDVYGNIVYEKEVPDEEWTAIANKNMMVSLNSSDNKVIVDCNDGKTYTLDFEVADAVATGDWVYMWNLEEVKVFSPKFPGMLWEMNDKVVGVLSRGDVGQVMYSTAISNEKTITVYTMK